MRFRCFGNLLAGSICKEGIGSVVTGPFAVTSDDVFHCEGKCAERGTSSRGKVPVPTFGVPALVCGIRTSR